MHSKPQNRSPIHRPPMRVAGESLNHQIQTYLEDKAYPMAMLAVMLSSVAAMEWWRWFRDLPPKPVPATVLAILAWVVFLVWLPRHRKRLRALRQGLDGERSVAEYLDRFREHGYYVYHDIMGNGFNIDHVLIGPTGVYTIETKTISKPARGNPKISFEGDALRVDGFKPDRDPVKQAQAQATWLAEFLGKPGGEKVPVQPVVVYPGWYVEKQPNGFPVWVMEPKSLESFLRRESAKLAPEVVKTLAWQMKQGRLAGLAGT